MKIKVNNIFIFLEFFGLHPKELEYLERICDKVGGISVDGCGGILKALRELVSAH